MADRRRSPGSGTNLDPGDQTTFTFDVTVADLTLRPFRNFAEISDDSAAELYGIADVDSRPDADPSERQRRQRRRHG